MILLATLLAAGLATTSPAVLIQQLTEKSTRDAARRELALKGTEAVPELIAHAHDDNSELRWEIANLLGAAEDGRGAPVLADMALHEANPHIRWRALWALSRVTTTEKAIAAMRQGLQEQNAETQWAAALGLSFFGSAEGVDLIHTNVRNADPFRRWEAINALGRVHNDKSVGVLKAALQSPSVRDRNEVVLSLGQIGGDEARQLLIKSLSDESSDVRWRAAMALGRAGDASVIASLRLLASGDPDSVVREQAAKAAAKLAKP